MQTAAMQTLEFTRHAQARMQQRGMTHEPTAVIQTYGTARFRDGAEVIFMDKKARKAARAAMGEKAYAKVADHLDSYLVMADCGFRKDRTAISLSRGQPFQ